MITGSGFYVPTDPSSAPMATPLEFYCSPEGIIMLEASKNKKAGLITQHRRCAARNRSLASAGELSTRSAWVKGSYDIA